MKTSKKYIGRFILCFFSFFFISNYKKMVLYFTFILCFKDLYKVLLFLIQNFENKTWIGNKVTRLSQPKSFQDHLVSSHEAPKKSYGLLEFYEVPYYYFPSSLVILFESILLQTLFSACSVTFTQLNSRWLHLHAVSNWRGKIHISYFWNQVWETVKHYTLNQFIQPQDPWVTKDYLC